MMTEMHDQSAAHEVVIDLNKLTPATIAKLTDKGLLDNEISRQRRGNSDQQTWDKKLYEKYGHLIPKDAVISDGPVIGQEPGMRFNYDGRKGQLHKIAQEITRSAGEDISFGEHKNAFESDVEVMSHPAGGPAKPREDLIFKNPDGTPKTTSTARLYPIAEPAARLAIGEPFTYGGARYSRPIKGMSTVQRIKDPALRKATMNAFDEKQRISGLTTGRVLDDLRPVRKTMTPEFYDKMVRSYRGGKVSFTFEEQNARRLINNSMSRVGTMANKMGAKRPITLTPDYVPEPISEEAIREVKAQQIGRAHV